MRISRGEGQLRTTGWFHDAGHFQRAWESVTHNVWNSASLTFLTLNHLLPAKIQILVVHKKTSQVPRCQVTFTGRTARSAQKSPPGSHSTMEYERYHNPVETVQARCNAGKPNPAQRTNGSHERQAIHIRPVHSVTRKIPPNSPATRGSRAPCRPIQWRGRGYEHTTRKHRTVYIHHTGNKGIRTA